MSQKEVKRAQVLDRLKENKIDQQAASRRQCITTRQVAPPGVRRYQLDGLAGWVSKKRGAASNRRLDAATCTTAIKLVGAHYGDFGSILACEQLAERHDVRRCTFCQCR